MSVFIPNCTVTVTNPDGTLLAGPDAVQANFQRDKRASLPSVTQERIEGVTKLFYGYRVRFDTPATALPYIGAIVNVVSADPGNEQFIGDWKVWDEPQVGTLTGSTVLFVQKKGQDE